MKHKLLFGVVLGSVVLLLIVAAFLSRTLFDLSISDAPTVATNVSPRDQLIAHTVVTASVPATSSALPPSSGASTASPADAPRPTNAPARMPTSDMPASQVAVPAGAVATVSSVQGHGTATREGQSPRVLAQGSPVYLNESLETGPKGMLVIQFTDGSVMTLAENSRLLIDEYVYNPQSKNSSGFGVRIVKGMSRVVTGMITELNPQRFRVRTRMATIGIRGCELAFQDNADNLNVYVLDVTPGKSIVVETTRDGSVTMEASTGREIPPDPAKAARLEIVDSGTLVAIKEGKGYEQRRLSMDEIRAVIKDTSYFPPAAFDLRQGPDGATISIRPPTRASGKTTNSATP